MLTELTNRIAIVLEIISVMMMMIIIMIIIITINKIITDRNNKLWLCKKYYESLDIRPYYNSMPKIDKRTRIIKCMCSATL
jgi:hypothetical protein